MKRKHFLFTLAVMLFGYCGANAEPINGDGDTFWTKYMSGVTDIKFHPSGETVLVAYETQGVVILNANDGSYLKTFSLLNSNDQLQQIEVSNDGKLVFGIYFENNDDAKGLLWDYETGELIRQFEYSVIEAFFTSDNKQIVGKVGRQDLYPYNLWQYDIDKDTVNIFKKIIVNNSGGLNVIATSPDGKYFALASVREQGGNDFSSLAIFDALTFEHIVDLVQDEPGIIEEIKFSENSKWIVFNTHVFFGGIIDLEEFLKTKTLKRENFQFALSLKFLEDEKHIIYGSDYPLVKSYIINYLTKDTVYYFNKIMGGFDFCKMNKRLVCSSNSNIFMFNPNWYYSDVPENTDKDLISNITYQNGTLKYSSSLENIQSIKITDLSGKLVFQSTVITLNNEINIALTKGVYFLTLSDDKSEYSKKFMVME